MATHTYTTAMRREEIELFLNNKVLTEMREPLLWHRA
jgi:hypothetical protein